MEKANRYPDSPVFVTCWTKNGERAGKFDLLQVWYTEMKSYPYPGREWYWHKLWKENEHIIYDRSCNNLQKNNSPAVMMSEVSCFLLLEGGATLSSPGAQTARTMTDAGLLHEWALSLKASYFDYVNSEVLTSKLSSSIMTRVAKKGKAESNEWGQVSVRWTWGVRGPY